MSARTRHKTATEARRVLQSDGAAWVDLAEAIGVLISDPAASLQDIMLGLRHGGIVAEHAALALYKRTGEPLPQNRANLRLTAESWVEQIQNLDRLTPT